MEIRDYLEALGFVNLNVTSPQFGETFRRSLEKGFECFTVVTIYMANSNVQITVREDCGEDDTAYVLFRGRLETVNDFETIFKYCGI